MLSLQIIILFQILIASLVSGFGLWLAVRLIDADSPKNSFIKAFLCSFPAALLMLIGTYGYLIAIGYIAIIAFVFYDLEPAQSFGVIIFWVLYLLILSILFRGIYWIISLLIR